MVEGIVREMHLQNGDRSRIVIANAPDAHTPDPELVAAHVARVIELPGVGHPPSHVAVWLAVEDPPFQTILGCSYFTSVGIIVQLG
jgi:hypothetical protein